jgi:hypothetical protein
MFVYDRQNHVWSFMTKYLRFLCKFTSWSGETPTGNFSDAFLSWTRIMSVLITSTEISVATRILQSNINIWLQGRDGHNKICFTKEEYINYAQSNVDHFKLLIKNSNEQNGIQFYSTSIAIQQNLSACSPLVTMNHFIPICMPWNIGMVTNF